MILDRADGRFVARVACRSYPQIYAARDNRFRTGLRSPRRNTNPWLFFEYRMSIALGLAQVGRVDEARVLYDETLRISAERRSRDAWLRDDLWDPADYEERTEDVFGPWIRGAAEFGDTPCPFVNAGVKVHHWPA